MKKTFITFFAGFTLAAVLFTAIPAIAESINVSIDKVRVVSSGNIIEEPTLLWNNKTYIPLRSTLENSDCHVIYNDSQKTAFVLNNYRILNTDSLRINGTMVPQKYVLFYSDGNTSAYYLDMAYVVQAFKLSTDLIHINGNPILDLTSYQPNTSYTYVTPSQTTNTTTSTPTQNNSTNTNSNTSSTNQNYVKAKLEMKQLNEYLASQGLTGSGYAAAEQQAIANKYGIPLSQLLN